MGTITITLGSGSDFRVRATPNVQILGPNKLIFLTYLEGRGDVLCFPTFIFYLYTKKKVNLLSLYISFLGYLKNIMNHPLIISKKLTDIALNSLLKSQFL